MREVASSGFTLVKIVGGEHRNDAGRGAGGAAVDGADARVRMIAAPEGDVQQARDLPVVDIGAGPVSSRGSSVRLMRAPTIFGRAWISAGSVIGVGALCAIRPIAPRRGRR